MLFGFIANLKFQMGNVLVTRNLTQDTRPSPLGCAWSAGQETRVRVERTLINVGTPTTLICNAKPAQCSQSTRALLAAWRLMVAVLWQSMWTVSVENDSCKPGKGSVLAFSRVASQREPGMAVLVFHPAPGAIPESLSRNKAAAA